MGTAKHFPIKLDPSNPGACVHKPKILFIDDSQDIRTVISIGLEHLGYEVVTVGDVPSTQAALERQSFDLVIVDNGLPGTEGVELAQQIFEQQKNPNLRLVLFTGTRSNELEARAKTNGFSDCWLKPMGLHLIGQKIDWLLQASKKTEG
jgi:two-component system chemotaxis response regulator CheY